MATITLRQPRAVSAETQRRIVGASTGNAYAVNAFGEVTVNTADAPYLQALGWLPSIPGGGGAGATSGTSSIDFGAFPGSDFASVTIAAVDAGDPNAILLGFVAPIATVDHSADEHLVDPPQVTAVADGSGNVVISGVPRSGPLTPSQYSPEPMPYGKWSVGYAFLA